MCQTSESNTFLLLMHFRVGGPAALALFVPLHTRLVPIWYLKNLSAQYASKLVKGSLSVPGQAAGGQSSIHSCFLLKQHPLCTNTQIEAFFPPCIFSLTEHFL